MKKYLTKTSVEDNKEAVECTLLAGWKELTVVISNKIDKRRLTIPYSDFSYPLFISLSAIREGLKKRIEQFFSDECKDKVILLSYSATEEMRIKQIITDNKIIYDL